MPNVASMQTQSDSVVYFEFHSFVDFVMIFAQNEMLLICNSFIEQSTNPLDSKNIVLIGWISYSIILYIVNATAVAIAHWM